MASADRDVLEALYRSTGGESWRNKAYWATTADLSAWHGVKLDEDGRVLELDLLNKNLQGIVGCVPRTCGARSRSA